MDASSDWEPSVAPLDPGTAVERYRVLTTLGAGGMATVYAVQHRQLGTLHALKVLTYDVPALRRRALQEARAQGGLKHPNVVAVEHTATYRGVPVIVMELVPGPSLETLLVEHPPALPEIDAIARGVLAGVAQAHVRGIVHRDVKPANVLVAVEEGTPVAKITDFGLVKLVGWTGTADKTRAGTVMGTPPYMSPEQLTDASVVDARADTWALGVLLYELLSGRRPFAGLTTDEVLASQRAGSAPDIAALVPGLPERMANAVRLALAPDRANRAATASELLAVWRGEVPDDQIAAAHGVATVWRPSTLRALRRLAPSLPSEVPKAPVAAAPAPRPLTPMAAPSRRPLWPMWVVTLLAAASLAAAGWSVLS